MRTAIKRALAVAAGGGIALAAVLLPGTASAAGKPATVYVSPTGNSGARDTSCQSAGYSVINDAIEAVHEGGTVIVCKGTYEQTATVDRTVTLKGLPGAVINATQLDNGIRVTGNGVTVSGFTVENATLAGILVTGNGATIVANTSDNNLAGVVLRGEANSNVIRNTTTKNSILGISVENSKYAHITRNYVDNNAPGGIGAGIGLSGSHLYIEDNVVSGNNEGIGLGSGEEGGGTNYSRVSGNKVSANRGFGIALVGFAQSGTTNAVDHNIITHNLVTGTTRGAGVLLDSNFFFEPNDSSAYVYDNTVTGNQISGNGGSGVAVHGYADASLGEHQHMDGNVITGNSIGTNNLVGDSTVSNLPDAPPALTVSQTTGVLVASSMPLSIEVSNNTIYSNYYGIWKNNLVTTSGTNHFGNVTVPEYTYTGG